MMMMLCSLTENSFGLFAKKWTFFQQVLINFILHLQIEFDSKVEFQMRFESKVIKHCLEEWLA